MSLRDNPIVANYASRNRFVPHALYSSIKKRKTCKICGRKVKREKLQIHHKIPISQGGKSDYQNCIGVCKECHEKLHRQFDDNYFGNIDKVTWERPNDSIS